MKNDKIEKLYNDSRIDDRYSEVQTGMGFYAFVDCINKVEQATRENYDELVKVQNEYIEFLSEHLGSSSTYMSIHGIGVRKEDIEQGKQFREKIKLLNAEVKL